MYEQRSLFDYEQKVNYKVADEHSHFVGWSFTRRNLFETCLLQYYYSYYGASKKLTENEPLKEQLHFLKSLRTIKIRAGEILHLAIRTYLKKQKQNTLLTAYGLINWAQKLFRADLQFSLEFQEDPHLTLNDRDVLLSEFYHNLPDAMDLWEEANLNLKTAISNFITSTAVEEFRLGASISSSIIEEKLNIKIGLKNVTGQIDLAFDTRQGTRIVDWKSGVSNGSDDSLQLLSYALLMTTKFGIEPERVNIYKIYLESEEILPYSVSEQELLRAKGRIIQDIDRMQSLDRYGKNALFKAFTPCEQPLICQMCPFRTVCPSSMENG